MITNFHGDAILTNKNSDTSANDFESKSSICLFHKIPNFKIQQASPKKKQKKNNLKIIHNFSKLQFLKGIKSTQNII